MDWAWVETAQQWYPYQFSSGQNYSVPERRLISVRCNSGGNAIPMSKVEHLPTVCWRGHGSVGFESAFTLVQNMHGDTIDNIAQVVAGSSVSSVVEYDEYWNFGDIPL